LDRIDLHVEVPEVDVKEFGDNQQASSIAEDSGSIRERITRVRRLQERRFSEEPIYANAEMKNAHIKKYVPLVKEAEQILARAALQYQLSARSYMKMIKIARTIADLAGAEQIEKGHMAEALQYRPKSYEIN